MTEHIADRDDKPQDKAVSAQKPEIVPIYPELTGEALLRSREDVTRRLAALAEAHG